MLFLRSLLFNIVYVVSVTLYAMPVALLAPFNRHLGYVIAVAWARMIFWCLKHICGIDWELQGRENIPAEPIALLQAGNSEVFNGAIAEAAGKERTSRSGRASRSSSTTT